MLEKIDRATGNVVERFVVGTKDYRIETARAARLMFTEKGLAVLRDFRLELEKGQEYETVGFLYRVCQSR
jgi:hypothetical protein